ncbi:MAG: nitroreductase family deazaflavin-dependent oxidoreductase [Anaerolineae bacterium]|nr:nitroreductase family deazaflavin-dependent oxidoreductase [Anaerolineae bacterium]
MNEEYLYLTTTGRKSGKPHEIEIWFVEHHGAYYLVSEMREKSDWVKNIQHSPAITFRVGTQEFSGAGRAIDPEKEPELAQAVSARMDQKYGWSEGLIVELKPAG